MDEQLGSVLVGTAGLTLAAIAAAWLTIARGIIAVGSPPHRAAVRLAVVALMLQAVHFTEELLTGFPRRFPELLALPPWPPGFFVPFNVLWLVVWALGCRGLAAGRRLALFPCWFLGIAGAANGIAHPVLSLRAGGYFPGLATSPLLGLVGLLLCRQLYLATLAHRSN